MDNLYQPHKSSIGGLNANVVAMLSYIASVVVGWIPVIRYLAWLVPLVIFFMEKDSKFIKFHAMQSFLLHVFGAGLSFLVLAVSGGLVGVSMLNSYTFSAALGAAGILGLLVTVIALAMTVFAVIAMIKAYGYKEYYIPVVGSLAVRFTGQR
ncbi:MAG: hypothetical protein K0S22_2142 [Oscillospiraceae bacterium]|nr:hypothetical protein [Oscillospiraceae bacterium]